MKPNKRLLLENLPLFASPVTLRSCTREDVDLLAAWPNYPFPYHGLEFSFRKSSPRQKDAWFQARQDNPAILVLVVDHRDERAIGYLAVLQIDWPARRIGNVGLRVHPEWGNQGIGTAMLRAVVRWVFQHGIVTVRITVAASNARAVRCYEKVGFRQVSEHWRDAPDLKGLDIGPPKYDFLRPHVRLENEPPQLRFLLMELKHAAQQIA